MSTAASKEYLKNAVLTASREQLQLMLYDGALRFAGQGRKAIEAGRHEETYNTLTRAQKIVLELQNGLNFDVDPTLCERMSGLYTFVYRRLVDANVNKDVSAVDDAVRILEHQRETWCLLMEKLSAEASDLPTGDVPGSAAAALPPPVAGSAFSDDSSQDGTLNIEG